MIEMMAMIRKTWVIQIIKARILVRLRLLHWYNAEKLKNLCIIPQHGCAPTLLNRESVDLFQIIYLVTRALCMNIFKM